MAKNKTDQPAVESHPDVLDHRNRRPRQGQEEEAEEDLAWEVIPQLNCQGTRTRHRDDARTKKGRGANPATDAQGLVDFACECINPDCERSVKVPLYVYSRVLEAGDQYLVQAAHHAFARYRTIVTFGLIRIEERG